MLYASIYLSDENPSYILNLTETNVLFRVMTFLSLQENQLFYIWMMRMEQYEKMLPYAVAD